MGALGHGLHPFLFFDGLEARFEFPLVEQVRVTTVVLDDGYNIFLSNAGIGMTLLKYDPVVTVAALHA